MKKSILNFVVLSLVLSFSISQFAWASELEEVAVHKIFVPATGYDDNDNIVLRVEGTLPDPCYVLGNTEIKRLADMTLEVHQYAWRRDTGVCSGGDYLSESEFSVDVPVGKLAIGEYKVLEHPSDGSTTYRTFEVSKAKLTQLDDFDYANVTQVSVPDIAYTDQPIILTFSGTLSSSCNKLSDVQVDQQNDVFVIRPIEEKLGDCGYVLKFFTKEVDLGRLPAGEYMIHIRAKNGRAVERTFEVVNRLY